MSNRSAGINSCHNMRNMFGRSGFLVVSFSPLVLDSVVVVVRVDVVVEVLVASVDDVVCVVAVVLALDVVVVSVIVVLVDDTVVDVTITSHTISVPSAMSKSLLSKFQNPKSPLLSSGHSVDAVLSIHINGPSPSSVES